VVVRTGGPAMVRGVSLGWAWLGRSGSRAAGRCDRLQLTKQGAGSSARQLRWARLNF